MTRYLVAATIALTTALTAGTRTVQMVLALVTLNALLWAHQHYTRKDAAHAA